MATQPSLLDDLGEEVTGIIAPVSLCMAVTVLLVRLLNPEGASSSNSVLIASIAYQEQASDSSGKKLGGALLNAIIFVAVIAGMTVVLFLLFKYKCYKFIYVYMGFAIFNIFFFLTGALFIQVMKVIDLHIDAFSLAYGLFNFSIVGTLGLIFVPIPLLLKQMYLIWVGIIVAYIFTFIPEWTSWVILVFMALYDIAAVLIPGGPLKALVELAMERKQELPALIYEARPAGGRPYVRGFGNRGNGNQPGDEGDGDVGGAGARPPPPPPPPGGVIPPPGGATLAPRPVAEGSTSSVGVPPTSLEMRRPGSRGSRPGSAGGGSGGGGMSGGWVSGPSQRTVAARDGSAASRGGGNGEEGPPGDAVRSFVSPLDPSPRQVQGGQQPRRGPGPRPVAEGRELEGQELEGEAWQPLPAGAAAEPQARGGGGGGGGGDTIRGRISRVLSGGTPGRAATSGVDSSSHTSQEPLIDEPASSDKPPPQKGQDLQAKASGAAGPGNPASASPSRPAGSTYELQTYGAPYGAPAGYQGDWAAGPSQFAAPGQPQGAARWGDPTMGVRAVAPALSDAQLADAVSPPAVPVAAERGPGGALRDPATPPAARSASLTAAPDVGRRSARNPGDPTHPPAAGPGPDGDPRNRPAGAEGEGEGGFEVDLPDAIKLGLGDFIFYSMLVGRAAMYDFMTVFSSYLAIIAGLGLTLLCLAIYQKALPALPFSIALGVAFYFLTRLTLEPFLVPMVSHLTYY